MRGLLGLRPRLLVAMLVVSAVTLLAAALALLGPLQHRLRQQTVDGLRAAALTTRSQINADLKRPDPSLPAKDAERLAQRTNARVALYTDASVNSGGRPAAVYSPDISSDDLTDVLAALATNRTQTTVTEDETRMAIPLASPRHGDLRGNGSADRAAPALVLSVRKRNTDVSRAVHEVRDAFTTAALIGLAAALVLGLLLSHTLSRRLERLRQSALRMTREGMDAPAPLDQGRDEVGDLARAMAVMQSELRRQEGARRQFVATASHELRTPLTSLSGTLELLGEDLAEDRLDPEDAREQIASAQGELRRLRNLATELLDLSRLDAGVALRSEPVELGELGRAVAAEFDLRARESGHVVEVSTPPGPCWAQGDPDAVARIARILIDNALHYTPPGSSIEVEAAYHGASATLTVADDGPGVAPADRSRIFQRFERGRETRGEGGFGLGLAIGRELAERLGGTLLYDATGADGARFVLTLPIELPAGSHGASELALT